MADKPVARVGDVHVCPAHGANAIVTGASSIMVNGRPVARVGDKTTCGAEILTGAASFFGQGSLVAYLGSTTSHGGLITTGSPDTFVGVEAVAVERASFNETSEGALINDPPLESVPIIPFEAAAQAVAELADTIMAEGLSAVAVGGVIVDAVMGKVGKILPLDKVKNALKQSRSSSEALGKAGMEQAKTRQGLKTDSKYTDRYHGPDDLARDKNGKLTEIEAKGNNRDSTAVAKNKSKENQSSKAKNERRAKQMTRQSKRKKIGISSKRQGGAYKQEEFDLWGEIKKKKGNKRHLSVHTNTETGRVRVLERDEYGGVETPKLWTILSWMTLIKSNKE